MATSAPVPIAILNHDEQGRSFIYTIPHHATIFPQPAGFTWSAFPLVTLLLITASIPVVQQWIPQFFSLSPVSMINANPGHLALYCLVGISLIASATRSNLQFMIHT
jgi:phosphoglycerol transferase MdoB-like AlkP superfamily enzyme